MGAAKKALAETTRRASVQIWSFMFAVFWE
jgi:hypothetical protein